MNVGSQGLWQRVGVGMGFSRSKLMLKEFTLKLFSEKLTLVCMRACMCVSIHVCVLMYVCSGTCMYVCECVCV